ncbi:MAG: CpsD/CapB family tyrosine-protein kinase [Solirubrobacteraceae bacterium]
MMREADQKVIAIAGFGPRVGKTSVVMGLADAIAERGRKVLVVDGDMRAAALSANYGHPNSPGLVDVLKGTISIEPVLIDLGDQRWLLPARQSRTNAAGLLSGDRTSAVIDDLRQRFDVIIFDSPPIAALADGLILASLADQVLIVARTGLTKPSDLTAVTTSLTQGAAEIAGLVVFKTVSEDLYYPVSNSSGWTPGRARVG